MADPRLKPLVLPEDERHSLENWVKRRSTAQGLALRADRLGLRAGREQCRCRGAAGHPPQDGPQVADLLPA